MKWPHLQPPAHARLVLTGIQWLHRAKGLRWLAEADKHWEAVGREASKAAKNLERQWGKTWPGIQLATINMEASRPRAWGVPWRQPDDLDDMPWPEPGEAAVIVPERTLGPHNEEILHWPSGGEYRPSLLERDAYPIEAPDDHGTCPTCGKPLIDWRGAAVCLCWWGGEYPTDEELEDLL